MTASVVSLADRREARLQPRHVGATTIVPLPADCTSEHASAFKAVCLAAFGDRTRIVQLDAGAVARIDADTLRAIVAVSRAAHAIGVRLTITGVASDIELLLSASGTVEAFDLLNGAVPCAANPVRPSDEATGSRRTTRPRRTSPVLALAPGRTSPTLTLPKRTPGMIQKTVKFAIEKETKGTFKYAEINGDGQVIEQASAVIGGLYIRKTAVDGDAPKRLTVTVEG